MTIAALNAAVTGTQAAQTRIDNIANNIANVNTIGFKKSDIQTSDLFYINLKKAGILENAESSKRPVGIQIGMGTKVLGTYRNLAQGPLTQTSHPLDIALTGPGYFAIALPNGKIGYTRAGSFKRDAETGNIVTTDGKFLTNNISIPPNIAPENVDISRSGLITYQDPNDRATQIEAGQLEIFNFPNEKGLEAIGDNMLVETIASGEAFQIDDTTDRFQQGWLEKSNVKAVEELTELITAQRAYELNARIIKVVSKVSEETNNII